MPKKTKRRWSLPIKLFVLGVALVAMASGALAAVVLFSQIAPTITNPGTALITTNCPGATLITFGVSTSGTVMACGTGTPAFTSGPSTGIVTVGITGTIPLGDALTVFISNTVLTACPSTTTPLIAAGGTTGTLSLTASSSYWYCVTGSTSISLGTISWTQ